MNISQHTRERNVATPQSQPLPGHEAEQVINSAGGYVFALDKFKQLERFLILGVEGGTYYTQERDLTKDNHDNLLACIKEDARRVVAMATDVSTSNRAPKNDYAIYVLALVAAKATVPEDRALAFGAMPAVCRIGTHLFQFVQFYTAFRGWSRMSRNAIKQWYLGRSDGSLEYQLLKYQSRNGWSHRDVLRLAHVKPDTPEKAALFKWAVDKTIPDDAPLINAYATVHAEKDNLPHVRQLISQHKLTWEMLPTELLKDQEVWEAMLPHMGLTALIRSLGRMSAIGMLAPFDSRVGVVINRLLDKETLHKARVHPFALLLAMSQYRQGRGDKGSLTWTVNQRLVAALADALELSFTLVEPTGKRILHALDVSGSMDGILFGSNVSCRVAECVMALASVRVEPFTEVIAFDSTIRQLPFSYPAKLDAVVQAATGWQGGRTDLAQPMLWALKNKINVDAFVCWTDNETWFGSIHPTQALAQYRRQVNPSAKLVVCGMTSTRFTIADPTDPGSLDVVGMDTSVPAVISGMLKS